MPSVLDRILFALNTMRDIIIKDSKTVNSLRQLLIERKGADGTVVLDAIVDSPFQADKIHYILALIKRDIWRHRHAIEGGTMLNLFKLPDADIKDFWNRCLSPVQQKALVQCACNVIDLVQPIAQQQGWDDELAKDAGWQSGGATYQTIKED
jgi:hypothetical protein